MNSKLLPTLKPLSCPDDYPLSHAKMEIGGKWYIAQHGGEILMLAVPAFLHSGIELIGFQCQVCKKTFVVDSVEELYHECMGVV